ncbi:MAG: peptidoglycan-binding protein [Granulosicoccus sp.]
MVIRLGSIDNNVNDSALNALLAEMSRIAGNTTPGLLSDKGRLSFRRIDKETVLTVSGIQELLRSCGFFPGGRVDGICGYRTRAAIRLFQEYVRSVENRPCTPDGIAGPKTMAELLRWKQADLKADWLPLLRNWETKNSSQSEFSAWLDYLNEVKAHHQRQPSPMLAKVNEFAGQSDTYPVSQWHFSDRDIHLIGVRTGEEQTNRKFDDVLILLLKGLVFKFQGSTDPGSTKHPRGAPFLVQGQHDYRIGLHQGKYHALRPLHYDSHGVLVLRAKNGVQLGRDDLKSELEVNGTINIHWGGKGVGRRVNRWSEGCQVITGSGYQRHTGELVDCSDYVGINNTEVKSRGKSKTRGAYNVLADLIVAMSSDMPSPGLVKYMLLSEDDLSIRSDISTIVASSRQTAADFIRTLA